MRREFKADPGRGLARLAVASISWWTSIGAIAASDYRPPARSQALLNSVDFSRAMPINERYRGEFLRCEGRGPKRNKFEGYPLSLPDSDDYLCTNDPSHFQAFRKLPNGAVFWHSKMALDLDGSWASWHARGPTDQQTTSIQWPEVDDKDSEEAQIDPDKIPYIVIPASVPKRLHAAVPKERERKRLGGEFSKLSGIRFWDMGIVIYRDRWSPVIVADGGPFMRIGEAASRVFENLGESRCRKWSDDGGRCIGIEGEQPYDNRGLDDANALYIVWPGSRNSSLNKENAVQKLCAFARSKLPDLPASPECR